MIQRIAAIDSHTGGEPTRVIWGDSLQLRGANCAQRAQDFLSHHQQLRTALMLEPRGTDAMVGALLLAPSSDTAVAEVIFFNNVGVLGMCGHGLIGVVTTLAFMKKIAPGRHAFDTPVGLVHAELNADASVTIFNVESYCAAKSVTVELSQAARSAVDINTQSSQVARSAVDQMSPGQRICGDVAWGGNWFFLVDQSEHKLAIELSNLDALSRFSRELRRAVNAQGFPEVDHIELFGPGSSGADSRNFVLCPGLAYDRSPCGTGTSAKLACLAAKGALSPSQLWQQESIVGSQFSARYQLSGEHSNGMPRIRPEITGKAFVCAELTLVLEPNDPFCYGIQS